MCNNFSTVHTDQNWGSMAKHAVAAYLASLEHLVILAEVQVAVDSQPAKYSFTCVRRRRHT